MYLYIILYNILQEAFQFSESQAKQQYEDMLKGHAYVIDVITQPRYHSTINKEMLVRIEITQYKGDIPT